MTSITSSLVGVAVVFLNAKIFGELMVNLYIYIYIYISSQISSIKWWFALLIEQLFKQIFL